MQANIALFNIKLMFQQTITSSNVLYLYNVMRNSDSVATRP